MQNRTTRLVLFGSCAIFFLLGLLLTGYAGIQQDEALFTTPIYLKNEEFWMIVFKHRVPLMLMSYLGTLKTWIHAPIFWLFGPNLYSLRVPSILIGSATIFFCFQLARSVLGTAGAMATAVLLAFDPSLLLTNTFDWGPLALQHLLLVTGTLGVVKFAQDSPEIRRWQTLAGGLACYGLALWDKAIFIWAMAGLGVATAALFHREILRLLRPKWIAVATVAFLLGALPLVIYNIRRPNATLGSNAHLDFAGAAAKFIHVRSTLDGSSVNGYIVREEWAPNPKARRTALAQASAWIRKSLGERPKGWNWYAMLVGLVLVPLWWRKRAAWFSLIFCAVTWVAMALTKDAGGSAHHVMLLWPFPQVFLGVVIQQLRFKPLQVAAIVVLTLANLLVINQYVYQFEHAGSSAVWSDATGQLFDFMKTTPAEPYYVTDWGMGNAMAFLSNGTLPLQPLDAGFPSDAAPNPDQLRERQTAFAARGAIFVGHTAGNEAFQVRERIEQAAREAGLSKVVIAVIPDSNGRPIFELYRLIPTVAVAGRSSAERIR